MGCQASKRSIGDAAIAPVQQQELKTTFAIDITATISGPRVNSITGNIQAGTEEMSEVPAKIQEAHGSTTKPTTQPGSAGMEGYPTAASDVTTGDAVTEITEIVEGSVKHLTILHFNDIYNIEPGQREPVGGAARLAWKVKSFSSEKPLVVFSGDAYNPSLMSTVTMGKQMVPVLNGIGVSVAAVGNHDFDYGVENMMKLNKQCTFPWLMANVLDKATGEPLGGALRSIIMDWNGVKVGLAGLVEKDWLDTLGMVDPSTVTYVDFVEEGRRLAQELKAAGAEVLIAVTHMRVPNDRKLASEVGDYDLVLGGHDHHYEVDFIQPHKNLMVKSGTDFRDLTRVSLAVHPGGGRPTISWERLPITSDVPEDAEVKAVVDEYLHILGDKMDSVLVETLTALDGCFNTVRLSESNLGNFVCDIFRQAAYSQAGVCVDIALINSGTLRSDQIHPAGELKVRDVMAILPMIDDTVVLQVSGAQLLLVLENGVSQYPKLEGRFPQVSGVRFSFDPDQPAGARVVPGSVRVADRPLELDQSYTLATKSYLADGKDGYDVLKECKVLVDHENGVAIPTALKNHFVKMGVVNTLDSTDEAFRSASTWVKRARSMKAESFTSVDEVVDDNVPKRSEVCMRHPTTGKWVIAPAVEGRIVNIRAANTDDS